MTLKQAGNIHFKDYQWEPFRGGGVWSYEDDLLYKGIQLGRFARDGALITGVTICAKELYPVTPEVIEARNFQVHAQIHTCLFGYEFPKLAGSPYLQTEYVDNVLAEGTPAHEDLLQKLADARRILDSIDTNQQFIDYFITHPGCSRFGSHMTDYVIRIWKGEAKPFDPVELQNVKDKMHDYMREQIARGKAMGITIEYNHMPPEK